MHQALNGWLDLCDMPLTVDAFSNNHPQFICTLSLSICDGFFRLFNSFLDVKTVEIYGSRWRIPVVLYFISFYSCDGEEGEYR